MAFMTDMYWEGTSGAAVRHSTRAGCCARCDGTAPAAPAPPPLPPSPAPAAARRCWVLRKHSMRLSALLSWQLLPQVRTLCPTCAAAAAAAVATVCCRPSSTATEGGPMPAAACGAVADGGKQRGEQ